MANLPVHQKARHVSREELYTLVWQRPMSRLAEEFGISGNGLAKICDRMDVPYPPRGYWAKREAGKPVVLFKLPPRRDGIPQVSDIYPAPPKPAPLPEAEVRDGCRREGRSHCRAGWPGRPSSTRESVDCGAQEAAERTRTREQTAKARNLVDASFAARSDRT